MATGHRERLIGIVLAAGAGERMGGSKALLVIEGAPLAVKHAQRLREAGCEELVIVTRAEVAPKVAHVATVAISTAPDPAGSLDVGMHALEPGEDEIVIVTPVDAWPAKVETIAKLVDAVRAGALAATPTYQGKGGHPVVLRARALLPLVTPPIPLRDRLKILGETRVRVDVDDLAVTADLDTPADVERWTGAPPDFG